ncbi:MAG TPA: MFS transporter, partial [Bacteroidota bacterium]|nr:MFS transporter [Bacteroidota bacterium]
LFDFANTAFSVIVVTVIYSRYFTNHVAGGRRLYWGLAVSISMVLAALLTPPLGAAADSTGNRKKFLLILTLLSVAATMLLSTVQAGMIVWGMSLFILANIGFEGGLVFYDAFLPNLTTPEKYGRVSGYGFAMGYLGALAVLLIVQAALKDAADPAYLDSVRRSFLIAGGFFLVFSMPLFLWVGEPPGDRVPGGGYIREGARRAGSTLSSIVRDPGLTPLKKFLLAFFLYNDGIITVITFAAIFADETLHMSDSDIIVFFAIVQTSAIVGSFVFGFVTDRIGPKRTILLTLTGWIGIVIGAYFVTTVAVFYVIAFLAGTAIGSTQSASRSMMALLTPKNREAEFFGFYDGLFGKSSAVAGPAVYGLLSDAAGERVAILSIGVFILAGLLLLRGVESPLPGGRRGAVLAE